MSFRAIFWIWKSKKSIFDQKLARKFMFFRKNIQISENRSTWRHQTRFFALVRRSFKSDSWYGRERMSKQAYFLGFLTIYIGGTRLFPNVTKVEISQEEHRKSFVSAWKTREKNLKFFFRKFETAARPNTGPEIWSKNPSSKFFKKKLFFLAMFKNEITTFKKKKFLKIFDFFFRKFSENKP